jgi:phage FluMu protein gp41
VFSYYLERHIEVDGESHGPMSVRMVEDLCRDNSQRWAEATSAAEASLAARLRLWDAVLAGIQRSRAGLSTGRK